MPMSHNSTLKDNKIIDKKDLTVSAKTSNFLKMFARSYHVDKMLPSPLKTTYVN